MEVCSDLCCHMATAALDSQIRSEVWGWFGFFFFWTGFFLICEGLPDPEECLGKKKLLLFSLYY